MHCIGISLCTEYIVIYFILNLIFWMAFWALGWKDLDQALWCLWGNYSVWCTHHQLLKVLKVMSCPEKKHTVNLID